MTKHGNWDGSTLKGVRRREGSSDPWEKVRTEPAGVRLGSTFGAGMKTAGPARSQAPLGRKVFLRGIKEQSRSDQDLEGAVRAR